MDGKTCVGHLLPMLLARSSRAPCTSSGREAAIETSQKRENAQKQTKSSEMNYKSAERNVDMAKIDTSVIEGFAEMTAEQKLEALQGYDFPEPDYSGYVKKDLYDKAASDAAGWKKKHNALLSDEQQKQQEQADSLAAMQAELETLRKEKTVAKYTADYVKLGYDAKLAEETAKAMADGDLDKVFANQATFNEVYKKNLMAEQLKNTPRGIGGQTDGAGDADLSGLSMADYIAARKK